MGASYAEDLVKVRILKDNDRSFQIKTSMKDEDKVRMLLFLAQNVDVFAWSPYEVPRVDLEFIVHRLNVDPLFPPKKQNPKRSTKEHVKAIKQKVKGSQGNKGGFLSGVAHEYRNGKKEEWQMESLHRLH